MGAAEGTKMDDDFVEMERVRKLKKFSPSDKYVIVNSWIFYLQKTDIYHCYSVLLLQTGPALFFYADNHIIFGTVCEPKGGSSRHTHLNHLIIQKHRSSEHLDHNIVDKDV